MEEDDFYRIRLPSNLLNTPGRDYVFSSVKAVGSQMNLCLALELFLHVHVGVCGVDFGLIFNLESFAQSVWPAC